jgi:hypothetical protein
MGMTITGTSSLVSNMTSLLNNVSARQQKAESATVRTPQQEDGVMLSGSTSGNNLTAHGYYETDNNGLPFFSVVTTLTTGDKQLIKDATGWDINADPQGNNASDAAKALAGQFNMDRYSALSSNDGSGTGLYGPVSVSYLQGVMAQQQRSGENSIPLSVLQSAEAYLTKPTN